MHDSMKFLARLVGGLLLALTTAATVVAHPGSGIVVDRRGCVYFLDTGSGMWMIDADGRLVRHEGPRFHWMAIDENGRPAGAKLPSIRSGDIIATGDNPALLASSDVPIAVGADGALYYPEFERDEGLRIVKFTRTGVRTVHAVLPADSRGTVLRWINGLAVGPDGSLYYTEDKAVRRIDGRGSVSTVASNVAVRDCVEIPGIEPASQPYFRGLAVAPDGTLFVAASGCRSLIRIAPRGEISVVLQAVSPWSPTAVAVAPSGLYVLEYLHTAAEDRQAWLPRVRKVLPDGSIVNIAAVERTKAH